jgi:hypothetical protein
MVRNQKKAKKTTPLRVQDIVRLEAPTKYRLTTMQKLVIQKLWAQQMLAGVDNVAAISRRAKCSREAVYLWRERRTVECAVGGGRPRTVVTPEAITEIKKEVADHKRKPLSHQQLRARLAAKHAKMSSSSLHRAKKELGIRDLKSDAEQDGLPLDNRELLKRLRHAATNYEPTRLQRHTANYHARVEQIIKRRGMPSDM